MMVSTNEATTPHANKFKRKIGLTDATAIVIGSMIGSGIFIVSSDIARQIGSPGWMLVVWIVSGLLTVIAALSYGELASMIPKAGGQYAYLRETYNPLTGFLYGWSFLLVVQGGSIAAVGMAFGKFLGVIVPWFSDSKILFSFHGIQLTTVHSAAIASIVFLTWINTRGVAAGKWVQNIFTFSKVGILLLFILIGVFFARNMNAIQSNFHHFWDATTYNNSISIPLTGWSLIVALGMAMVGALFALDAWNNITFAAGEVKSPRKTVPRSLFYGTFIVAVLYILTNIVYMMALPLSGSPDGVTVFEKGIRFASDDRIGTASMEGILGNYAAMIMAFFVVISTFGCNNGMILSGARVYYAMAKDKLFFKSVGLLNKKGVPARGLVIQCIWSILLCLSGSYNNLLDFVIGTVLLFYALTIAGVFVLRIRHSERFRKYKVFGYPYIPAFYVISTLFIVLILIIYKPDYTRPGMYIILSGIPVYFIWKRINLKRNHYNL